MKYAEQIEFPEYNEFTEQNEFTTQFVALSKLSYWFTELTEHT